MWRGRSNSRPESSVSAARQGRAAQRFGLAEEVREKPARKSNDPDRCDAGRHTVHPALVHAARGEHREPEDGQVEDDAVSLVEALFRAFRPHDREAGPDGIRREETARRDRTPGNSLRRPKANRDCDQDAPEGDDRDRVPVRERVAAAVRPDGEYSDGDDQEGRDVGSAARSKDLFVQVELSPVASYPEIPGPHTPGTSGQVLRHRPIMFIVTFKRSLILSAVLLVAALAGTAGTSSAAIKTGVYDLFTFSNATQRADALDKTRNAGGNLAKSLIWWRSVAPGSEPANPTNPNVGYNWAVPDAFVNGAIGHNLEPVLTIFQAPNWASGSRQGRNGYDGVNNVDSGKFHDFAVALATHYAGQVHYYEVWNEPNLPWFFTPQLKNGKFVSPAKYRQLVNAFATGIHSVAPGAVVIAGNTAPFGHPPPSGQAIGPKPFLKGVTSAQVHFDAWSTHPYTYGGPTHDANKGSDVSLGDMGELRRDPEQGEELGEDPRFSQAAALGVRVQLGLPRAGPARRPNESSVALDLGDRLPPEQGRRERAALVRDARPAVRRDPDAVRLLVLRYRGLGRREQLRKRLLRSLQ